MKVVQARFCEVAVNGVVVPAPSPVVGLAPLLGIQSREAWVSYDFSMQHADVVPRQW